MGMGSFRICIFKILKYRNELANLIGRKLI